MTVGAHAETGPASVQQLERDRPTAMRRTAVDADGDGQRVLNRQADADAEVAAAAVADRAAEADTALEVDPAAGVDPVADADADAVALEMTDQVARVMRTLPPGREVRVRIAGRSLVDAFGDLMEPLVPAMLLLGIGTVHRAAFHPGDVTLAVLVFFVFAWRLSFWPSPTGSGLAALASAWVAAAAVVVALSLVTGSLTGTDWFVIGAWFIVGPLTHYLVVRNRQTLLGFFVGFRRRLRVVVVGANEVGVSFANELAKDKLAHVELVAYFDDRSSDRTATAGASSVRGRLCDLADFVRDGAIDQVFVALPMAAQPRILQLLRALRDTTASVYFIPNVFTLDLIQSKVEARAGYPIVSAYDTPFRGVDGASKRICDVVIALVATVLTMPVMVGTFLAVKLTSPGPAIFRQRRYGLDGKEIVVYKFRSMTTVEDGSTQYTQTTRGDARLTRVGAFIRKTSLDELPQLFNVLQGRMSLVGPRPHVIDVTQRYRRSIDGYMQRHKVRPGITGWAQIHGYRGGDDLQSMKMRVAYDIDYLRRWSIWLDLYILCCTLRVVWKDSRAF